MSSDSNGQDGPSIDAGDTNRRSLLKAAGAMASAGALGSLAGCAGGGGSTPTPRRIVETRVVRETVEGEERTVIQTRVRERTRVVEKQAEDNVVSFWSANAVETPILTEYYRKELREFEQIHDNKIIVNMQGLSYNNLKTKYATTVEAGAGIPDLAEAGTFGLEQFHNGNVLETSSLMEEDPDLPHQIVKAHQEAALFRDDWWAVFNHSFGQNNFAILNSAFKAVGIQDPHEEMQTWTQVRRAFNKVQNQKPGNVQFAHEVTGTTFDVEQYWGKARTSYKDGVDPWLDVTGDMGTFKNPYIKVNNEPRTDGMILNNIDLGQKYSSPQHPNRSDEECYPLMVQGTLASQMYGTGVN
ncbi:MAG: hypothetical protein R3324_14500, partial [Halobacteriales archaeon]|nr:hypothetical protein [Halobacteriales archaeon]